MDAGVFCRPARYDGGPSVTVTTTLLRVAAAAGYR
jgi:hypothetical protein